MDDTYALCAVFIMTGVTALLRFLPFLILGNRKTPVFLEYLGGVLPYAVMAMLVIYCMKDINMGNAAVQIISVLLVVGVHVWKRNTLLSIILGTVCYMALIRIM